MWPYHPELLERPVPRYTSYPTAAEFHEGVGAADMAQALDALPPGSRASLYVHIPYCERICHYCGCNTGAANRTARLSAYLDALHAEISLISAQLGGRARIAHVAFGGGSPNAVAPGDFLNLADRVKQAFDCDDASWSIEVDPRSLSAEWAGAVAAIGFDRASLGVQTFAPHVQRAIGRVQPAEDIERTVGRLRRAGVASLNFDLMYGLPAQGMQDLIDTLRVAERMRPDRIALFGYAHVPHLIPRQRRIDATVLAGARERFAQAAIGHELLVSAGYQAIGFDHFALSPDPLAQAACEGRVRRNFQGFTDDDATVLIGLGASAISQFPDRLIQNEKNAGRYRMRVAAGTPAQKRGVMRTPRDRARGRIMEEILAQGAASLPDPAAYGDALERLAPFIRHGLAALTGGRLLLLPGGLPYARAIAACFDTYRQETRARFSSAI